MKWQNDAEKIHTYRIDWNFIFYAIIQNRRNNITSEQLLLIIHYIYCFENTFIKWPSDGPQISGQLNSAILSCANATKQKLPSNTNRKLINENCTISCSIEIQFCWCLHSECKPCPRRARVFASGSNRKLNPIQVQAAIQLCTNNKICKKIAQWTKKQFTVVGCTYTLSACSLSLVYNIYRSFYIVIPSALSYFENLFSACSLSLSSGVQYMIFAAP